MKRAGRTARQVTIPLRATQGQVFTCDKRFRVLVAGRRFGKTHLALVELLRAACGQDRLVWYVAPTYRQAKRIAWHRWRSRMRTRPTLRRRFQTTQHRVPATCGCAVTGAVNTVSYVRMPPPRRP